jgi:hypothetical protein
MTKRSQRRKLEMYGYTSDGRALSSVTAPANTTLPSQVGPGKVGVTQVCNPGVWTGAYARTSYQWKINGVSIPGATAVGYTPQASDATKSLTCVVTATNPAGSVPLATNSVVVVP